MRKITGFRENIKGDKGFTLLEIIIVMVIISILSLLIVPRISNFFNIKRTNFLILTTTIAKTFDDSYINNRLNFLVVHLYEPMSDSEEENELFSRTNGISVVNLGSNGSFTDSKNKLLKPREFSDSFKIEEVILSTGEAVTQGNVFIPFYPEGNSDNVILHILINEEERWSIRIFKMRKEPEVKIDYIKFDTE